MKKNLLVLVFMLPFMLNAQLDKLHPGMRMDEFHKNFPSAVPDLAAMTSDIYKTDTIIGVKGESRYEVVKDSVKRYVFHSIPFSGPGAEFPKADSADYIRLVRAAEELAGHYSDVFGVPSKQGKVNPRATTTNEPNSFYAIWEKPDAHISVTVRKEIEVLNMINAPVNSREKKKNSSAYVLEIFAEGKWSKLRIDFEIGITKNQFRALMPALASQVKDFPDCWMMNDTLGGRDSEWHFWFVDNVLAGFTFDSYNGDSYGSTNKAAYPILLKKAQQFLDEEQKSYGAATVLQVPPTDAYVPVKKVPTAFSFDDIYYNAEWEMDKGKTLFIRLHESGGKGSSSLHLEVYFGEKEE
ncbi:MAG: hypothetical protein ABIQ40_15095 [Bacteroidia bacterium]